MTKNHTQSDWVKQSNTHWTKYYPKKCFGQIFLNLQIGIYEVMVTDKNGLEIGLTRIAKSLENAKKAGDNLYKENVL